MSKFKFNRVLCAFGVITFVLISLLYWLDNIDITTKPKEVVVTKDDLYFNEVLRRIKAVGLEKAIPEVKLLKEEVFLAARVSCELSRSNINRVEIKRTIFSSPQAVANTEEEKQVLNIIINTAIETYCE